MQIVCYHSYCWDGLTAAWLLSKIWPAAKFIPVNFGDNPPEVTNDDNLVIVDFSWKREVIEGLKQKTKSLLVIDHHKSAQKELEGLDYCVFDMDKSGASLVYDHFRRRIDAKYLKTCKWLVDYVEDRDLYRHHLPHSRAVAAAIRLLPIEFSSIESLLVNFAEHSLDQLIIQGEAILKYEKNLIDMHVLHALEYDVMGMIVKGVPCTMASMISDIGNALCKGYPFAMIWWDDIVKGNRHYSLRSAPDGIDVGELASKLGGGGHKHAAGFHVPMSDTTIVKLVSNQKDGGEQNIQ